MKRGNKRLYLIVCIILFAIFFLICIYRINKKYPEPVLNIKAHGESFEYNGYLYTVNSMKFLDEEQTYSLWNNEKERYGDIKVMVVNITIEKIDADAAKLTMADYKLCSESFSQGVDFEKFMYINQNKITKGLSIDVGETLVLDMPFLIPAVQFRQDQWKKIEDEEFYMLFELYPTKIVVRR